jgi:hypothetical protein
MIHSRSSGASHRERAPDTLSSFCKSNGEGGPLDTYLFSGYARLPQDVSHQPVYGRVGVVLEVDERGTIVAASSTLLMDLARDFLNRLLVGRSVLSERAEIEAAVRRRYLGHSQGALIFALHKVFEAVDQSPLAQG